MSFDPDRLIQAGRDVMSFKYYAIATGTVLFYDHLMTLSDEIKYVWSGKKSWVFWLFMFNRYFPMTYQLWQFALLYGPGSPWTTKLCEKTAFYSIFMAVVCTLLAQVLLTVRIYAVSMRRIPIAIGFAAITLSQLALGIYMITLAVKGGVLDMAALFHTPQSIPLDAYHLCLFQRRRVLDVAYSSISLLYDILTFACIIYFARKTRTVGLKIPSIWGTIAEDATRYFLVIFTSHFVFVMTLNFGRESIQLLPAPGTVMYLPVMISRIMLSLRKAADKQRDALSFGSQIMPGISAQTIEWFESARGTNMGEDGIPLDTYPRSRIGLR